MIIVTSLLPLIVLLPPFSSFNVQTVWIDGFTIAGIFVLLALGLNIVVGLSGLLDLGYAAFFAIGAYTFAYVASPFTGLRLPVLADAARRRADRRDLRDPARRADPAPARRLPRDRDPGVRRDRADRVPQLRRSTPKGTNGIGGIPPPAIGDFAFSERRNPWPFYITMIALITIVLMILCYRLQDCRLGRAWMAIREDELAAAANGINTVTTKLLAFALGASTAGLAGVFNVVQAHPVSPNLFRSRLVHGARDGGPRRHGQHLGRRRRCVHHLHDPERAPQAAQHVLRQRPGTRSSSDIDFIQFQFLLYGIALVAMMLLRPEGLFPSRRRKRELHTEEDADFGEMGDPLGASPE